jgi:AcrR family transcriptional regulator
MTRPLAHNDATEAFLDAAERLLITVGYANITARRLGEEAGFNHSLIHYYFGSMEQLFVLVLERFSERLLARQRALYASDAPFIEKWRAAMRFLDEDRESGYHKIYLELEALSWNRPDLQARIAHVHEQWLDVLQDAFGRAMREYGLDSEQFPVEAVVALVATFNGGMIHERQLGVTRGHAELLAMIDRWLVSLELAKSERERNDHASQVS